jgi:hypothetical protein
MVIDFQNRIDTAKIYLERLNNNLSKGWLNIYQDYLEGKIDDIDKITMIHPDFIKSIHLPVYITHSAIIENIQGKRLFKKENGTCQSKLIWGYECSFGDSTCHGDHLFPYSMGGPTISANKLLLCSYHNMVKATDIHLFPWEERLNRFSWVDNHVQNIMNSVSIYI